MSFFDPSLEPMLEMFFFETTTLLDQLDEIMLESEKNAGFSKESINEIFRIMHTIKGSSAMMGLDNISKLAHHVEDMFFIIRENPQKLGDNSSAIFDCVFLTSDFLKSEVEKIQNPDYAPTPSGNVLVKLEQMVAKIKSDGEAIQATAKATADTVAANAENEENSHKVRVFFEDGCQMENIRAFMLLNQLKEMVDYLESVPANPESNSDCANDIINHGLLIKFTTQYPVEEIYSTIEQAVNIRSYEVVKQEGNLVKENPNAVLEVVETQTVAVEEAVKAPVFAAQAATAPEAVGGAAVKQNLISVNQSKLDQLMDLVGEIVIAEAMVASNPELKHVVLDSFYKATRQLRKLTDELQDVVMSIRMVPLNGLYQKMNRIVRDMSKKLNKEVDLITIGGDTEIDKTIIDSITDPFMHMIRNSMDHAIELPDERAKLGKSEAGKVTLSAQNVGGEIVINIIDDGRGLVPEKLLKKARENGILTKPENEYTDKEAFNLIMLPGFSTKEVVTEFSGRGVGMDVVRQNIEKCGGTISVDSKIGEGTTFTIKIPLTLAIIDGMALSVGGAIFTIPITSIKQSFKVNDPKQLLHDVDGNEMIMLRGECYPIIRLHEIFSFSTEKSNLEDGILILIENENKMACIFADELIGEQQVVVKPFPPFLAKYDIKGKGLSGCTILGDGGISLILDSNKLLTNNY